MTVRVLLLAVAIATSAVEARAACNLIPGTEKTFSAAVGAVNRPYAAPGERLEVKLRACDASPGFLPGGDDHVVTVVFKPTSGTDRRVVVLAANCGAVDLSACSGPGVLSATCVTAPPGAISTRADVDAGDRRLAFGFPDTDALRAPDGDDVTLAGPAAIAVTPAGAPPACGLATAPCSAQSGLLACVDALYANDGACGTAVPNGRFTHFTALPPPNDYQADCFKEGPPCTASAPMLRAALKAVDAGVDGLVVEGGEGGGFKNPKPVSTMVLLPLVRSKVDVPIVAAGGICDGVSMAAAFALGAEGVQMGTRMVSAAESPVGQGWKDAIVAAEETGTVFLRQERGPALRALRTERTTRLERGEGNAMAEMVSGVREARLRERDG